MKRVYLSSVSQNSKTHKRLTPSQVYAELHEYDTDELIISATLEYIATAIQERGYELVLVQGGEVKRKP